MNNLKKIILCADDFGLNPHVCEGILKLAHNKRLSAISCMVNKASFNLYASQLRQLESPIKIGLHFNLTDGYFLSDKNKPSYKLTELIIKSQLHLIDTALVEQELLAQWELFIKTIGRPPDFVDGHQHVHQFPVIRSILLKQCQEHLRENHLFVRSTYPMISLSSYRLKNNIITYTGGKKLKKELNSFGIPHNCSFAGIYDFSPNTDYRFLFRQWLNLAPEGTLIMCHPAEATSPSSDPMTSARIKEMNYLASKEFLDDCMESNVVILS